MARVVFSDRLSGRVSRSARRGPIAWFALAFATAALFAPTDAVAQHHGGGHGHGGGHHHGGHHHGGGFNGGLGGGFGFGGFSGWNNTTLIVGGGYPFGGFYGGLNYFSGPIWGGGLWGGLGWPYPFYMPPVVVPAETWFGPRAMERFLGLGPDSATLTLMQPQLLANQVVVPPANPVQPNGAAANAAGANVGAAQPAPQALNGPAVEHDRARPVPKVRETNDELRARAARRLAMGDDDYRAQRYGEAYNTYRRAAEIAPDLYEAYFRQGQALVALRRCDDAVRAFKRGLDLDPTWPRRPMRLDDLYGPNQAAQLAHLEALAKDAAARPGDASPILLLGIELYCSGQTERARRFFDQAASLAGDAPLYAELFLRVLNQPARPARIAAAPDDAPPVVQAPGVEL